MFKLELDDKKLDDKPEPEVTFEGDRKAWQLVTKTTNKKAGWTKITKKMIVHGGWVYQMTSEHRDPENGRILACAEAAVFVPYYMADEQPNPDDAPPPEPEASPPPQ